jgi:tetratricopeptide (TPR) repeat protein
MIKRTIKTGLFVLVLLFSTSAGAEVNRDIENSIMSLREEIKAAPSYSGYSRLGYLLLKKDSIDEAMESFSKALELRSDYHNAKTGKGIVLSRKGDLKAAEAALQDALILNPDPVRTHYELGLVYEKMGEQEKAIAEYKEGIRKFEQGRR